MELSIEFYMFLVISSILGLTVGVIACILAIASLVKVMAFEKSTHRIQYMPIDPEIDKQNEEFVKKWATTDQAFQKEQKLYTDELSDEMPEFAPTDEDKEIFSL
jgi:uncharacterized membrane-anchored protein YhcB (DUF1043 family)